MRNSTKWLAAIAPAIFFVCAPAADLRIPLGLPPVQWPKDNPYSREKAELGRFLYFDKRISADGTVSCATCHHPDFAYTDGQAVSTGVKGQKGNRSAPTVINRAYSLAQFWDGRAASLEEQAKGPMANPLEMGTTHEIIVTKMRKIPGYSPLFFAAFGTRNLDIDKVAQAIATFERTILSGGSAFDRYKAGDKNAMTPAQVRGFDVFENKAKCDSCHEGANFTTNEYHNIGIGTDKSDPDVGRLKVTGDPKDWCVFKTPTLRDVARTGPYMHDGSLKTLRAVVDYYDKGGTPNKNLDEKIKPLHLTDQDKDDVVEFLKALNGTGWQKIQVPVKFPE